MSKKENEMLNQIKINRPKGELIISGANFWDFETEPEFIGYPLGTVVVDPKGGRVLGYNFVDEQGEAWIIGAAHSITKAMEFMIENPYGEGQVMLKDSGKKVYIKWLGKVELRDSGKTFNRYEVIVLKG